MEEILFSYQNEWLRQGLTNNWKMAEYQWEISEYIQVQDIHSSSKLKRRISTFVWHRQTNSLILEHPCIRSLEHRRGIGGVGISESFNRDSYAWHLFGSETSEQNLNSAVTLLHRRSTTPFPLPLPNSEVMQQTVISYGEGKERKKTPWPIIRSTLSVLLV